MSEHYFVTGISTDVGKTVVAAVIAEALGADYWKPVQAGDLHNTDTDKVRRWLSNGKQRCHPSSFALNTPMSPHAAADIDGVSISVKDFVRPQSDKPLVVEGAGGLLVPINHSKTVADLILSTDRVIVVSRHYLGSINHTLLTVEALRQRGHEIAGLVFVGEEHPTTEEIILKMAKVPLIGRMDWEPFIDHNVIKEYADRFREQLIG